MTKNPFYNALFAIAYIALLVTVVFFTPHTPGFPQESIFYPMAVLSTLVFSVARMAYLFFYHPALLLLDGQREKGVKLFLHTVGIFGLGIILFLLSAYFITG